MLTAAAAATARRRRRHAGVHVRANEGIWTCERIRKGGSWRRLRGDAGGAKIVSPRPRPRPPAEEMCGGGRRVGERGGKGARDGS